MTRLVWARMAVPAPLGQEKYQDEVIAALRALDVPGWQFDDVLIRSIRSPLAGRRRIPMKLLARAPMGVAAAIGAVLYPPGFVHRWDLRLPPARRELVTVLDAAPLRFRDEGTVSAHAVASARGAIGAICCSTFAAEEAQDVFGVKRTWVAPGGVDERFRSALPEAAVPGPYVLHVGGSTSRKNLHGLAGAWAEVRRELPELSLVLVGPPSTRRTELFGHLPGVAILGRIPDYSLPGVMAAAAVVVVPSTYEGFGLPVLEAMAAGTPVVAASSAALPEVVGDAGLLVLPTPEGLAEGIVAVVIDDARANEMRRLGRERASLFTWERAAKAHLQAYAECA